MTTPIFTYCTFAANKSPYIVVYARSVKQLVLHNSVVDNVAPKHHKVYNYTHVEAVRQ